MAKIIIEAMNSPSVWQYPITTGVTLRIYANIPFQTYNGQWIGAGSPNTPNSFWLEIPCEIQGGNILYIPSFEIDSTEDSPTDRSATYTAWLFANGARLGNVPFLAGFGIPEANPNQEWTGLILHRDSRNPPPRQGVYDIGQVEYLIAQNLGLLRMGSETQVGMVALTEDPIDPTFPIAVSPTDPNYIAMLGVLANRGIATLIDGAVTIFTVNVLTGSIIGATSRSPSVTGVLYVDPTEIVSGVSFVIRSTNIGDNGDVSWMF